MEDKDDENKKKGILAQNKKVFDEAQELVNLFQLLQRQKEEEEQNLTPAPDNRDD